MLALRQPRPADWQSFYALAEAEGWKVPLLERQLFQGAWAEHARVLADGDSFCGLITALPHQRSGWLGNLLVAPQLRGRGYGAKLFAAGLSRLRRQGVTSIWLTASELGRPIYEKSGFVAVDRIERWVLPAQKGSPATPAVTQVGWDALLAADRRAWGESRRPLLEQFSRQGQILGEGDAVALLQQGSNFQIIGPWYARNICLATNALLLQKLVSATDPRREILIDLIASSPLRPLFAAAGFICSGQNQLMVCGETSSVKLKMLVALASLGSVG